MKNTMFIGLIAATSIAIAGGAALARGDQDGASINFETLDTDNDGRITQEEMQNRGAARLAAADTDGDGFLTEAELAAAGAARAATFASRMIERLDTDADGQLSAAELQKPDRATRRFNRLDTDGDGGISQAEFDAARENMRERRGGQAPTD